MGESIFLGIDIGTTSAKCLAVSESGEILALAQHAYPMSHPRQDWAEQDPENYYRALVDVVTRCIYECEGRGHSAGDIKVLAMSTQGDTLIVTDETGNPLVPAMSWMDKRAEAEYQELLAETGGVFWYREIGQTLNPLSSACKIRWIQKNAPELWSKISRICYVPDYLALKLCGEFVTDTPSASWSPFYSPTRRAQSQAVMDVLKVSQNSLPQVMASGMVIGELLPEVAAELHLAEGTKLIAGAFDQAAAACGAGACAKGRSVLSCGTAWVLYCVSDAPIADPSELTPICCHINSRELGMVLPFTGGAAYDWLARTLPAATEEASTSEPLIFIPHLYGGLSPDWRSGSKGSLLGLTMSHTPKDIRLALMRGIAFETRRNVEAAGKLGAKIESIRMVGGAVKSDIWPQMIANVLDRQIEISDCLESACYGAAKLAAGAVAENWAGSESVHVIEPDAIGVQREERQYAKYLKFYEALSALYDTD